MARMEAGWGRRRDPFFSAGPRIGCLLWPGRPGSLWDNDGSASAVAFGGFGPLPESEDDLAMNGKTVRISRGGLSGAVALTAAILLAPGSLVLASAAKKDGMVDYSAPVRVRVKKPASADQIDPNSYQVSDDGGGAYDGKQMEVAPQREVRAPQHVWQQGDLDELPPPAWEDCKKTKPRFRPLEGPHGRFSAGVIYREFEGVEFTSRPMGYENNVRQLRDLDYMDTKFIEKEWAEDVDGGGPYVAFDLLFPIADWFQIGQQVSFSYSQLAARNQFANFRAEGDVTVVDVASTTTVEDEYYNDVNEELEADIFTLGLGPLMEFDFGPVFAQTGFGLAINLVQFHAAVRERLYNDQKISVTDIAGTQTSEDRYQVDRWEDGNHGSKFLFGFYVQGLLGVQVSEHWSLAGFARYDWNDDLDGEVGESNFSLDLTGFSAGAQLGYSF